MKRLEDIPKSDIFKVPEGYFDHLPTRIQERVANEKSGLWSFASARLVLRLAVPIVLLVVGAYWWQRPSSIEEELEGIDVEQLAYFIDDTDLANEDLAESMTWSSDDLQQLEETVYSTLLESDSELDNLLDEIDSNLDNL